MLGLLHNNLYSIKSNLKTATFISILFLIFSFIMSEQMSVFLGMPFVLFGVIGSQSTVVDVNSKWHKFQLILPVRKQDIIKSKYLTFIFLIVCGLLASSVIVILHKIFFNEFDIIQICFTFSLFVTMILTMSAISYPLLLKFGVDKEQVIAILSMFLGCGLYVLVGFCVSFTNGHSIAIFQNPLTWVCSIVVAIVLLVISYFCSLSIYNKNGLIK